MRTCVTLVRVVAVAVFITSSLVATAVLAGSTDRPYRGSCATVITPVSEPGVFPQELHIDYDCRLAHLGHATASVTQFVTPTGQTGVMVTANIENATVYTAANGDTLNVTFVGTGVINLESGQVRFIGTETFTGGTGRFAGASGTADLSGTASIFTNVGQFTTQGDLAY